jgi:hypothetical protein
MKRKEFDEVEAWANYIKTHKREEWKPQLKDLIDSQIIIANRFYKRLEKMPGGKEKIRKLMKI